MTHPMKNIKIEKITLNFGAGKEQRNLEKGVKLIKTLTGIEPVKTKTNKRIAGWGLRPGLPIGCKLTLRGKKAEEILKRLLEAKDNNLKETNFDDNGNISFGVPEYIDIPGLEYDPELGVIGLQISCTLQRAGFRIRRRKRFTKKIRSKTVIKREESFNFIKESFNVKIGETE
jgi:large subunit ribosomal protein L5